MKTILLTIITSLMLSGCLGGGESYIGGDFEIPSTKGTFKLKDYRGKVVVLYFGYRYCPDVCPTTLSVLSNMYHSLSAEEREQVQVLFISVDTQRDSIDRLAKYIVYFQKDFIAATSTEEHIQKIASMYGVRYKIHQPKVGKKNYSVDHSTQAYVIGKDGKFVEYIAHGEGVEAIKNRIKPYLGVK
jgi:protein SCO1/2